MIPLVQSQHQQRQLSLLKLPSRCAAQGELQIRQPRTDRRSLEYAAHRVMPLVFLHEHRAALGRTMHLVDHVELGVVGGVLQERLLQKLRADLRALQNEAQYILQVQKTYMLLFSTALFEWLGLVGSSGSSKAAVGYNHRKRFDEANRVYTSCSTG